MVWDNLVPRGMVYGYGQEEEGGDTVEESDQE